MRHVSKVLTITLFFTFSMPHITARTNVYLVNNTDFKFTRGDRIKEWRGWKEALKWTKEWKNEGTSNSKVIKGSMKIKPHSRKKIFSINRGHRAYKKYPGKGRWSPRRRKILLTFEKIKTNIRSPEANYELPISVQSKGQFREPPKKQKIEFPGVTKSRFEGLPTWRDKEEGFFGTWSAQLFFPDKLTVYIKAPEQAKIRAHYRLLTKHKRHADVEIILDPIERKKIRS